MFYRNVIKLPLGFTVRLFLGRNLGSPDVKQDGRWNELSKLKAAEACNIKEEEVFLKRYV